MTTINNTSADAERAAFEAAWRKAYTQPLDFDLCPYGTFRDSAMENRYIGWKLAVSATPATADVAADSIAPMAPHGTLLPEGDEFVRLMSAWRMADIGDQSRAAFDAVVSHINAWGHALAAGAPAETVKVADQGQWEALRADVLHGIDGLDNDQTNSVLSLIDFYMSDAKAHPTTAPVRPATADGALHFNASRLRNVAHLVGLEKAIPEDDATLDNVRGAVLGMIARHLRAVQPATAPGDGEKAGGALHDALTLACKSLPAGCVISVCVERESGWVEWSDSEGMTHPIEGEGFLSDDVTEAFNAAIDSVHTGATKP